MSANPTQGASDWGYAVSLSGLFLLLLGPICGAIADHTGRLKIWIFFSGVLFLLGTALLGFGVPNSNGTTILIVLAGLVLANIGFELAIVFYNALLPNVSTSATLGKVSSRGWAMGYAGGLISLILMLLVFIGVGGIGPFIDLPKDNAMHIRIAVPIAMLWFISFALPLFLYVPDRLKKDATIKAAISHGWVSLKQSFMNLKTTSTWRSFLIGSAFYREGLNTLFALGGIYAAQKYDLKTADILMFGIGMNITAGLGAYAASFIEDKWGSFNIARISVIGLLIGGSGILFSSTTLFFFISALFLGLFVGPVQSASRTLVARLSSDAVVTENYGLYALTGRAAAFLGPFCYAVATDLFHTQNAGVVTILLFWIIGFAFISKLKDAPK